MPTFEINTVGLDKHVENQLREQIKELKEEKSKHIFAGYGNQKENEKLKIGHTVMINSYKLGIEKLKEEIAHKNEKFCEWIEENKELKEENEKLITRFEEERNKTTKVLDILQKKCEVKQGTMGDIRIKDWDANDNPAGVVSYFIDSFKIKIKKLKEEIEEVRKCNDNLAIVITGLRQTKKK